MARYKPDYWRKDTPEPTDYAVVSEPGSGAEFESGRGDMMHFAQEVANCINLWVEDHSRNLDAMIDKLKDKWISSGGNDDTWATVMKLAWGKSGYCKNFSREANKTVNKPKKPDKKENFNGLDFSAIKGNLALQENN